LARKVKIEFIPTLLLGTVLAQSARAAAVRVWQGTISIPTYLLGPPDPNPPFPLVNSHDIYPYTALDDLTAKKKVLTYPAIYLENEYLKATILPDMGGRVYSLYDKTAKREIFYRNHVIKYGLVGLRGAWISGGIEFNFPNGHTTDTVSPVGRRFEQNADGSATVIVGDVDQVSNMHWEVALTLRPGVARLEQRVTLFNSTPLARLYWWWANAAVPATQDMQFIYPMREVNPHSHTEIWTFPVWKGVNYSWYKDVRHATSLFGVDVHRNFFGAYYHNSDDGVIHVADYHQVYGKKTWTWGVAGDGLIWTRLLTDEDGAYNEIQAGRFQTQLSQEFLAPHRLESWTEYWYPVQGLGGGFVEGAPQLAVNVIYSPGHGLQQAKAELAVSPAVTIRRATIAVRLGSRPLKIFEPVSFDPLTVRKFSVPVGDLAAARMNLDVTILGPNGQTLLHWFAGDPIDGSRDFVSRAGLHPATPKPESALTTEGLFLQGVTEQKEGRALNAARIYRGVLRRDPAYIPAILKLAQQAYLAADFSIAEALIVRATAREPADSQVHYLAGVIYRGAGRLTLAQDEFWKAIRFGNPEAPPLAELGEIAIRQKRYIRAESLLRKALTYNPDDGMVLSDLAVALRLGGHPRRGAQEAAEAANKMPLLPYALAEQWRTKEEVKPDTKVVQHAVQGWRQAVGFRSQSYLEAGAWYRALGDLASSDGVLETAAQFLPGNETSPLIYYYLAANAWDEGQTAQAGKFASRAAKASPEGVFPDRVSDAAVLESALAHNGSDSHAQYLLGNFLFAHERYQSAAELWSKAASEDFQYSVLYRNLGVFAWRISHDLDAAAHDYQKAIDLDPQDFRLYVDLDELYTQTGDTAARERLLLGAPADVQDKDTVRARKVLLYVQMREYDQALEALSVHQFKPWEGGQIIRELFVLTNIEKGRHAYANRQFCAAERAFREALTYPENLGVGKPDHPTSEEALYWLGKALEAEGKSRAAQNAWQQAAGGTKFQAEEGGESSSEFYAALALDRLGDSSAAAGMLDHLASATAQPQASAYDFYVAGLVADYRSQVGRALADFRHALKLEPTLWQARFQLEGVGGPD
jgi:tetratricopeptide (TPR) repeat protein